MSGLKRVATTAGKYNERRISARPPRICSRPCHFPDCRDIGARPARDAACLPESFPSSGISVSIAQAVTVAIPGILVRISALSERASSCAITLRIAASTCARSCSICFRRRLNCVLSKGMSAVCARAFAAVRSLIKACRAVAKSLRTFELWARGCSASRSRSDPIRAKRTASTLSVFAS